MKCSYVPLPTTCLMQRNILLLSHCFSSIISYCLCLVLRIYFSSYFSTSAFLCYVSWVPLWSHLYFRTTFSNLLRNNSIFCYVFFAKTQRFFWGAPSSGPEESLRLQYLFFSLFRTAVLCCVFLKILRLDLCLYLDVWEYFFSTLPFFLVVWTKGFPYSWWAFWKKVCLENPCSNFFFCVSENVFWYTKKSFDLWIISYKMYSFWVNCLNEGGPWIRNKIIAYKY